ALAETGVTVFVMRDWPRIDRWLAMAPDERRALAPATRAGTEVGRGGELIRMLGARGDLESLELMIRMLAGHPERAIRMACAHALAALPDPRAHAALDAHWADADSSIGNVAVRAAVFRDLATVWSRFLPAIQIVLDRRSDTPVEEEIVRRLLYVCHGGALPRKLAPDGDPLVVEPRLIELAARLRRHDYIGQWARSVLGVSPRAAALAAIERYPHEPVLARVALPERRDFLARYLAGERGAWNELIEHALAVVQHAELRAEAHAVAREIMKRVRHNAEAVRATLCEAGARVAPIGTPADDGELARLEAELGAPAPIALDAFWRVAGAIALVPDGDDRHDYGPCALERDGIALIALDPLVVAGARHALEAAARQQRDIAASHREIVGPLWLDFAPDYLHKQNISGGAPYAIELPAPQPADAVDPRVTYYRHRLRFVDYLRHAFHWAGFPILEVAHRPVDRIAANDRIAFERVSGEWGAAADRLLARLRANLVDF
ncbi:MAG TPA: HEAT repeat domain-containing protein, partial [Kofleriaceae bacterium]|nr:HEAT repeat domain-containing protein [Kofleriaceae bacterium]